MMRPRLVGPSRWATTLRLQRRWRYRKAVSAGLPMQTEDTKAQAEAKYPIIKELQEKSRDIATKTPQTRTWHRRCEIVSPELCDDVLSYIGPSLQKHMNCDILDLNPGIGIWSSKLHEYLKPRTHILLEPHAQAYKNQLDPLLLQEESVYKLLEKPPHLYSTYEYLIEHNFFPHQTRYDRTDPRIAEQNNTLLITGSLNHDPPMPGFGAKSVDRQLLQRLLSDAWEHRLIHVYGKVRMLLWTSNEDMRGFIAKSVTQKATYPLLNSKLFNIREVVSPKPESRNPGGKRRDPRYQLQSATRAVKSMRKLGLEIPPHRQSVLYKLANDIVDKGIENDDLGNDGSVEYLEEAERKGMSTEGLLKEVHRDRLLGEMALEKDPSIKQDPLPKMKLKNGKGSTRVPFTDWGRKHGYNMAHTKIWLKDRQARSERVDMGMEIYRLECKLMKTNDEAKKQTIQTEIAKLTLEFEKAVDALIRDNRPLVHVDLDERFALNSPTPLLDWDGRTYEPLEAHAEEFWPQAKISLLDFEPKILPHSETPPGGYQAYLKFVSHFSMRYQYDVGRGLELVQNGASELAKSTPELRDPVKGGRPDLRHFRLRLLTVEMIDALYKAYMEWPFREPQEGGVQRNA